MRIRLNVCESRNPGGWIPRFELSSIWRWSNVRNKWECPHLSLRDLTFSHDVIVYNHRERGRIALAKPYLDPLFKVGRIRGYIKCLVDPSILLPSTGFSILGSLENTWQQSYVPRKSNNWSPEEVDPIDKLWSRALTQKRVEYHEGGRSYLELKRVGWYDIVENGIQFCYLRVWLSLALPIPVCDLSRTHLQGTI